ncbi:MAG: helicase-associated domain-containing protein [Anaerolineales bacterium]|nr:MAG: helicase-associated domain-containing protein [Anaerolineales bacterium]
MLYESLVDYDLALLRGLAEVRGAVLASNHRLTAADELAAQLSTPASLAIALADLSAAEMEALAALREAGGWMEGPRFTRRFGGMQAMGPGRLERERPWLSPANPAEGLWYRALIFKGFRQTEGGVVEVVYIPTDILGLLPQPSSGEELTQDDERWLAVKPTAAPTRVRPASPEVVEDVFGLLVVVRNQKVRLSADGTVQQRDLQSINLLSVSPIPAADVANDARLAFILHLVRGAELIVTDQGRLVLNPDPARAWLKASPAQRLLVLQKIWRDDPDWNDLWHVPSLKPQPTGWKNDPVLARRKALSFLADCQFDEWYGLDELIMAVKANDPDFQRPGGDYNTWYIYDPGGQALMGFEHWDQVEGALLRYLVSGPLHWLGVVDLGFKQDLSQPTAFRLADAGQTLLGLVPPPVDRPPPKSQATSPAMVVRDDFIVRVSPDSYLYTRFQLARFADFLGRQQGHIDYRISPTSMARARGQGISPDQVIAFLQRTSDDHVPAKVLDGLRSWQKRSGSVHLEQGVLLRVDRPETLAALRRDPVVGPLLGEGLGSGAVLVPQANVGRVRRWLADQGYLSGE